MRFVAWLNRLSPPSDAVDFAALGHRCDVASHSCLRGTEHFHQMRQSYDGSLVNYLTNDSMALSFNHDF